MYGEFIAMSNESKTKRPFFSILIPTTGRPELIRMAVKSVLEQSFQDFEIVISDLSTSPESERAATDSGDPRIRYLHPPPGPGLITWDHAAKEARGEYVMWFDDDNYLLPQALELFREAIRQDGSEIITASHFYYYDQNHPRRFLRNGLGIIPFTGQSRKIDLRETIRSLYDFGKRGPGQTLPRFHFSATVISRQVIERAIMRLGFLLLADMPNIHSLQPIMFAFAKSCFFIDRPVVIVGRLGVSMSQAWSTAAHRRFQARPFKPEFSPVSAYTRVNGILENYLRVQQLLPDLVGGFKINYARFAELYLRELFYLDTDFFTALANWLNLFGFLETLPAAEKKRLKLEAVIRALGVPLVLISRRMKLHHLWRAFVGPIALWREKRQTATAKLRGKREFAIPIPERYHIDSIAALAASLDQILQSEANYDISTDLQSVKPLQ